MNLYEYYEENEEKYMCDDKVLLILRSTSPTKFDNLY
jgi:hypothetical protein